LRLIVAFRNIDM